MGSIPPPLLPPPGFVGNWTSIVAQCHPYGARVFGSWDFLVCEQGGGWVGIHFVVAMTVFYWLPSFWLAWGVVALAGALAWVPVLALWTVAPIMRTVLDDHMFSGFHKSLVGSQAGDVALQGGLGVLVGWLYFRAWGRNGGPVPLVYPSTTGRARAAIEASLASSPNLVTRHLRALNWLLAVTTLVCLLGLPYLVTPTANVGAIIFGAAQMFAHWCLLWWLTTGVGDQHALANVWATRRLARMEAEPVIGGGGDGGGGGGQLQSVATKEAEWKRRLAYHLGLGLIAGVVMLANSGLFSAYNQWAQSLLVEGAVVCILILVIVTRTLRRSDVHIE